MRKEFNKEFLKDRDHNGRFIVKSLKTGRVFYVEPIAKGNPNLWGDFDPVSKKHKGNYGSKYIGSITEDESMLTTENGFEQVHYAKGSPFSVIEKLDS